ncbi:MAG: hypothetical protein IJD10_05610 [Clostridia bacterium]|nr:hypothetical protein [Clostridia bacterium]
MFNSDELRFGGSGVTNKDVTLVSRPNPNLIPGVPAEKLFSRGIRLRLPPLGAVIVKLTKRRFGEDEEEENK